MASELSTDNVALREWQQHEASLREKDKRGYVVIVDEVRPTSAEKPPSLAAHWRPGLKERFPWMGAAAIMAMLLCMGLVVLILVSSNGKAQEEWPSKCKRSLREHL